jgi:hypothetical protein
MVSKRVRNEARSSFSDSKCARLGPALTASRLGISIRCGTRKQENQRASTKATLSAPQKRQPGLGRSAVRWSWAQTSLRRFVDVDTAAALGTGHLEADDLHLHPVLGQADDEEAGRLEVAVDDVAGVGALERVEELQREEQRASPGSSGPRSSCCLSTIPSGRGRRAESEFRAVGWADEGSNDENTREYREECVSSASGCRHPLLPSIERVTLGRIRANKVPARS